MKKLCSIINCPCFCTLVLSLAISASAVAQCTNSNAFVSGNANTAFWSQSFTATCTGNLESVTVTVADENFHTFRVFDGEGCAVGLHTQTINCSSGTCLVTLNALVFVNNGAKYTFQFESNSSIATLVHNNTDTYADGLLMVNSNCFPLPRDVVFTVEIGTILPIELVLFTANLENQGIQLDWQTASEQDNRGFEVQRSTDALHWEVLYFENGNGTTVESHDYSYWDEKPASSINYYRLRQVDYDDQFKYSKIVCMKMKTDGSGFRLFPNPAKGQVEIEFPAVKTDALLQVFDQMGVLITSALLGEGQISYPVQLQGIPSGMYTVSFKGGDRTIVQKLVVLQ